MQPPEDPLPSPEPPVLVPSPRHPQGSAFWNADQPEFGFQQLGLIPFTPKAGHAPPTLPPGSCGPEQLAASLPHLCTRPLERRNTTKGGWAVTSGQWDLGWEAPQEGRQGGADRQGAKCNFRQNHSPTGGSLG